LLFFVRLINFMIHTCYCIKHFNFLGNAALSFFIASNFSETVTQIFIIFNKFFLSFRPFIYAKLMIK